MNFRMAIELIWITVSLIGLSAALYGVIDVYKDFCAAKEFKGKTGVTYIFARGLLRAQIFRSTKLTCLLSAAFVSLLTTPGGDFRMLTLIYLLTTVTVLTGIDSVLDRLSKGKVVRRLAKGDHRKPVQFDITGELPLMPRNDVERE